MQTFSKVIAPVAQASCSEEEPSLKVRIDDHYVACHLVTDTDESPITFMR